MLSGTVPLTDSYLLPACYAPQKAFDLVLKVVI